MTASLILLFLSLLGILDAAYLTYAHLFGSGACGAGSGCGAVMASPYSRLFGIPLSTLGLGLYLAIAVSSWRSLRAEDRETSVRWVSLLALIGNVPTLFLLYLQAGVIRAWCAFCLVSAAVVLSILLLSVLQRKRLGTLRPFVGSLMSRDLMPVGLAIVMPSLLFVALERGVSEAVREATRKPVEIVARIGHREIKATEMDRGIYLRLYQTRDEFRKEWLDHKVVETAAREKGMDVREFVQREIYGSIQITQEEIDRRYEQIKDRLPAHVTKAEVTCFGIVDTPRSSYLVE